MWKWNLAIIAIVLVGIFVMLQIMLGLEPVDESFEQNLPPAIETTTTPPVESPLTDWDAVLETTATVPIQIGNRQLRASVADTDLTRQQGLSGTTALPPDIVKLFVFESDGFWGIWMKDMNYPIDIVWLDEQKTVVHIESEVLPDTFPDSFQPPSPARYVIETHSGLVTEAGLAVGDTVGFDTSSP